MTLSPSDRAVGFSAAILGCTNVDQCTELFLAAVGPLGIERFACGEIDIISRNISVIYATSWSEQFIHYFFSSGLIYNDPFLDELTRRHAPFQWSDVLSQGRLSPAGKRAYETFQQFGASQGLLVPLPRSGSLFGVVCMQGTTPNLPKSHVDALIAMAVCLYERCRRLVPKIGTTAQYIGLTGREIDCLKLIAQGRSDKEIGLELKISPSTAHDYVESAKTKLSVSTRSEAAAIAVSLSLVAS